ncbi:PREDICTED: uncharacterized protein LOC108566304 [Nicrophorus vespilloides]|uniref:Uncharacterized protein LOC108566304 n=1 Tax=Nicrophorus vespilloides TaxID=110193 RepID=A0ABM1N453_NICVS|nr:PREDICTED: uncharacterized protein LOC108566304 [Nicrophorus vespilloides]
MNGKVICVVALCFVALATAGPAVDDAPSQNLVHANDDTSVEDALMKKLNNKCSNHDVSSCMMLKLMTYFNRLLKKSQIELGDLEITQTSTETVTLASARSLGDDQASEETQLTAVLADKALNFLRTRSLKWKVTDDAEVVLAGKGDKDGGINLGLSLRPTPNTEGDARKKKDSGMGALIAAAALKIGLLKALAFKALVLLVGKALLVSKLALVLAAVIGLKKLFSQEKHVTYEVVAHPHHETHHEHSVSGGHGDYSSGGWARQYETGNSMAYRGQIPTH